VSISRADVIAYLEGLTSQELGEFMAEFQERLHLAPPASQPRMVMGMSLMMGVPLHEPDFVVELIGFGERKLTVMQAVRQLWPLGLMEAKRLVESAPVVLRAELARREAEALAATLREAGAEIRIRLQ
jgi:large subunit ribosomal protein L7/L12